MLESLSSCLHSRLENSQYHQHVYLVSIYLPRSFGLPSGGSRARASYFEFDLETPSWIFNTLLPPSLLVFFSFDRAIFHDMTTHVRYETPLLSMLLSVACQCGHSSVGIPCTMSKTVEFSFSLRLAELATGLFIRKSFAAEYPRPPPPSKCSLGDLDTEAVFQSNVKHQSNGVSRRLRQVGTPYNHICRSVYRSIC